MNASNSHSAVLATTAVNPFCQLVGRDIPATQCLEMQGQEGCFGCAAPTRLCEDCKTVAVDVPAVGLCSKCLAHQLRKEEVDKFFEKQPESFVQCQIIKGEIRVEMCLATQGQEGCKNCPAPSRLCEKCKERPCRIPQYGLCLHCSIDEFGEGWNFEQAETLLSETRSNVIEMPPPKTPDQPIALQEEPLPMNTVSIDEVKELLIGRGNINVPTLRRQLPHLPAKQARNLLKDCESKRWVDTVVKQGGWRKVLIGKTRKNKRRVLNQNQKAATQVGKYMPNMKKALAGLGIISISFVCRKFRISRALARLILNHCEKEGLVGPARKTTPRVVLMQAQEQQEKKGSSLASEVLLPESRASTKANSPTHPQKITKLNELINLFGEGELSTILQSIIVDLKTLQDVNRVVRHRMVRDSQNEGSPNTKAEVLEVIRELVAANEKLSVKTITGRFLKRYGQDYDYRITTKWMGGLIQRRLHLKTQKSHGNFVIPPSEWPKIQRLFERETKVKE